MIYDGVAVQSVFVCKEQNSLQGLLVRLQVSQSDSTTGDRSVFVNSVWYRSAVKTVTLASSKNLLIPV